MSIVKALAKSRWKGTMLAAATAGIMVPTAAQASMTVNLYLAPLGSTSPKSLIYINGGQTSTDIPVYVYAMVTGTAVPSATNFDGLQYLYYNILNSTTGAALVSGGIDTATGFAPTLNATLGFNGTGTGPEGSVAGNGAQPGTVQNTAGGVSVGANASSVAMTDYAKPRSPSAVFNTSAPVDGTNIIVSGNSVSFLVETLYFKPTAFVGATATAKSTITFSAQVPTLTGVSYAGSNYFQDSSTSIATIGSNGSSLAPFTQTAYTAGSSVTITDTATADINRDGVVNGLDFNILVSHFNQNLTGVSNGDLNGDGVVNGLDFNILVSQFNFTVGAAPSEIAQIAAEAAAIGDTAGFESALALNPTAVPEPATLGLLALGTVAMAGRRRRTI